MSASVTSDDDGDRIVPVTFNPDKLTELSDRCGACACKNRDSNERPCELEKDEPSKANDAELPDRSGGREVDLVDNRSCHTGVCQLSQSQVESRPEPTSSKPSTGTL